MDAVTILSLIIGLTGIGLQVIAEVTAPNRRLRYVSAALIAAALVSFLFIGNPSSIIAFYRSNIDAIAAFVIVALVLTLAFALRLLSMYRSRKREETARIIVKEHVNVDPSEPFHEIVIDARKNCGKFYFVGKCLVLPKGSYKITPNPSDPGGWSAWDSDDNAGAKRQLGAWTWKVFVSIPGITGDFDGDTYVGSLTYRRAWQIGPETNWWRYRSKEEIKKALFAQSEFPITLDFELPSVSPVWFWIWDEIPQDNRGKVILYLYRIA